MSAIPWNKGLDGYNRGWRDGYGAGVRERFWPKVRTALPIGLLLALVVFVRSRRTAPIVRLFALELVVFGGLLVVVLLPIELPVVVVAFVRHRRRLAELRAPGPAHPVGFPGDELEEVGR